MRELWCFDMTHVLHSCQSCGTKFDVWTRRFGDDTIFTTLGHEAGFNNCDALVDTMVDWSMV